MPITTSAKKALRRDRRRMTVNRETKQKMKMALKRAKEKGGQKFIAEVYSTIDRAAKRNVITRRKAGRIKSRLMKSLVIKKQKSKITTKSKKKSVGRKTSKKKSK